MIARVVAALSLPAVVCAAALVMLFSSPTASHLLAQIEATVSGRGKDFYAPTAEDEGGETK